MSSSTQREIHLAARPVGTPKPGDFRVVETPIPEPAAGQFLVRNVYMSVDPYMRGRMRDVKSYVPPFQIGAVLDGGSVGQVIASRHPGFAEGDCVVGGQGFREYYVTDGAGQRKVDPKLAPLSAYLGVLGMPGLTAYVGLLDLGKPKAGETLLVSAAAGAVGMVVGQIGKILGLTVVGTAGGPDKARWLRDELGFDAAFDYRAAAGALERAIAEHCPQGVDIYFENVGGAHARGGARQHASVRSHPAVRHDRALQRRAAAAGPAEPDLLHPAAPDPDRVHRLRPLQPVPRLPPRRGGWLREGRLKNRETDRRRDRERPGRLHRPPGRRERRQDAGSRRVRPG